MNSNQRYIPLYDVIVSSTLVGFMTDGTVRMIMVLDSSIATTLTWNAYNKKFACTYIFECIKRKSGCTNMFNTIIKIIYAILWNDYCSPLFLRMYASDVLVWLTSRLGIISKTNDKNGKYQLIKKFL